MKIDRPARKADATVQRIAFDPILPADMAVRAEESGVKRVSTDPLTLLVLSILAGAFISFGAIFATTVSAGSITIATADGVKAFSTGLPYGVVRLLTGLAFSLGLILVAVAGAELFTGNNLIVMAWASGKVKTRALLLNWAIVFAGNFAGAFMTAGLMFYTTQYTFGGGSVGLAALSTANSKASLAFVPAVALGIMCNALVCLAVMDVLQRAHDHRQNSYDHSADCSFRGSGVRAQHREYLFHSDGFVHQSRRPGFVLGVDRQERGGFPGLTWENFLIGNLVPVTIGNIIGGSIMVAAVYWFVYLRKR